MDGDIDQHWDHMVDIRPSLDKELADRVPKLGHWNIKRPEYWRTKIPRSKTNIGGLETDGPQRPHSRGVFSALLRGVLKPKLGLRPKMQRPGCSRRGLSQKLQLACAGRFVRPWAKHQAKTRMWGYCSALGWLASWRETCVNIGRCLTLQFSLCVFCYTTKHGARKQRTLTDQAISRWASPPPCRPCCKAPP